MRKRRIIALLAAVVVSLGTVFFFTFRERSTPSVPRPAVSQEELHRQWRSNMRELLADYDSDHDAPRALDRLLALHVGASDRDLHLRLALALQAVIDKNPSAETSLRDARAAFGKTE